MGNYSRRILYFDFEVFCSDWMVTIAIPYENRLIQIWNDREEFVKFYKDNKESLWIGYNVKGYDRFIVFAILCDFDPWKVNNFIIRDGRNGWAYSDMFRKLTFYCYDIMDGFKNKQGFRSLKELEGFMLDDIRETTVDFNITRRLIDEEIEEVLYYNKHDVMETINVFRKVHELGLPSDFEQKLKLLNLYHLPANWLSQTNARITEKILGAEKREYSDVVDIQIPQNLEIDKYRAVVEWFRNPDNRDVDMKKFLDITIAGMECRFAWGGAHGVKKNTSVKDIPIIDADITSMYPSIMINYDLLSRSIPEWGKKRFEDITRLRKEAKKRGDKLTANAFKIIINAVFGLSGDPTSKLYDPRNKISVCVTGQLLILDYVEHLEKIPSVEFYQINTDGVFFTYDDTDETFQKIDEATREWEKRTGMGMEFEDYNAIYQRDVNNYVAVTADGKAHRKGELFKSTNDLNNNFPIVQEAVYQKIVNNVPIHKTISECNELWKFQKIVKLSHHYRWVTTKVKKIYGKTIGDEDGRINAKTFRVFASNDITDTSLYKVKADGTAGRWGNMPMHVIIHNDSVKGLPCPPTLDKTYYENLAYDKINDILKTDSLF